MTQKSEVDERELFEARQEQPTKAQALAALDDMDDYARMTVGVDAVGPRETLRRFIEAKQPDSVYPATALSSTPAQEDDGNAGVNPSRGGQPE